MQIFVFQWLIAAIMWWIADAGKAHSTYYEIPNGVKVGSEVLIHCSIAESYFTKYQACIDSLQWTAVSKRFNGTIVASFRKGSDSKEPELVVHFPEFHLQSDTLALRIKNATLRETGNYSCAYVISRTQIDEYGVDKCEGKGLIQKIGVFVYDVPTQSRKVDVTSQGKRSVTLYWTASEGFVKAPMFAYLINVYESTDQTGLDLRNTHANAPSFVTANVTTPNTNTTLRISELKPYRYYRFEVIPVNKQGYGKGKMSSWCRTDGDSESSLCSKNSFLCVLNAFLNVIVKVLTCLVMQFIYIRHSIRYVQHMYHISQLHKCKYRSV